MPHPKEDRIREHGVAMTQLGGGRHTPKRRRCPQCGYEPPNLRVSSRCPTCKATMRVIRYD